MGTLDTLIGVANLGANLASANKLHQMTQDGTAAAMMQAVIKAARDEIFQYSEKAKDILSLSEQYPKEAAGAMRLLNMQLQDSGLTPDIFPDLSDKEYMSNTMRFIRENSSALKEKLPPDEQAEVDKLANIVTRLPEYNYYVDHYDNLQKYREYLPKSKETNAEKIGTLSLVFGIVLLLYGLCGLSFGGDWLPAIIAVIGLPALLYGIYWLRKGKKTSKAKMIIRKIKKETNLEQMEALDKQFKGNIQEITQIRDDDETTLRRFFGNSPLLSVGK